MPKHWEEVGNYSEYMLRHLHEGRVEVVEAGVPAEHAGAVAHHGLHRQAHRRLHLPYGVLTSQACHLLPNNDVPDILLGEPFRTFGKTCRRQVMRPHWGQVSGDGLPPGEPPSPGHLASGDHPHTW